MGIYYLTDNLRAIDASNTLLTQRKCSRSFGLPVGDNLISVSLGKLSFIMRCLIKQWVKAHDEVHLEAENLVIPTYTLMLKETHTHFSHSVIYYVLSLPWQTNLKSVLKNDPVQHFPENTSSCIRTAWFMSQCAAHFIQPVWEHLHNSLSPEQLQPVLFNKPICL